MLVNMTDLLTAAAAGSYIIPGFNVFGLDEAWEVMKAAEQEKSPVILMTNKDMVSRYPVELLGNMLKKIAQLSSCPVCVHLDHTYDESIIYRAMESGYTSVMFDGSQLSLKENISRTLKVSRVAHNKGISVEGEIGSVPYPDDKPDIKDEKTSPAQAAEYAEQSQVDAVAVAVGNIHKLKTPTARIDFKLLKEIEELVKTPLVVHGTSGISQSDMAKLIYTRVAKCNIGTLLRQAWGHNLRDEFMKDQAAFDRLTLTKRPLESIGMKVVEKLRELGTSGKA